MKAPFALPVKLVNDRFIEDDTDFLVTILDVTEPLEREFLVYAINNVNRFADAITEFQAATDAEMDARPGSAYQHHLALRRLLDAKRTLTQLAKELACLQL